MLAEEQRMRCSLIPVSLQEIHQIQYSAQPPSDVASGVLRHAFQLPRHPDRLWFG